MPEDVQGTTEKLLKIRERSTELGGILHEIGLQIKGLGEQLLRAPEWALFQNRPYPTDFSGRKTAEFDPEELDTQRLIGLIQEYQGLLIQEWQLYRQLPSVRQQVVGKPVDISHLR